MKKITGTFDSATGLCKIHFYMYTPEKPKAVLMLSHGMCEYIERYEDFAEFLCKNDIAFCGHDHIGHGKSVSSEDMLGFFGSERGYINMVRDIHRMAQLVRMQFPGVPRFLLGHSMGSFLARIYISKYRDGWRGVILTGTAGGISGSVPLRRFIDLALHNHGELYRLKFGTRLAFGIFNLRTENHRTKDDWLSRDDENVDRYLADPKCNFMFTTAGYRDLLNALHSCNSRAVIENTPKNVPILFLSGGMDPVGEYGSGVRSAARKYLDCGCNVTLRIYREARHELLFELNKKEVYEDILEFMINRI